MQNGGMRYLTCLPLISTGSIVAFFVLALAALSLVYPVEEGIAAVPIDTFAVHGFLSDPDSVLSAFLASSNSPIGRAAAIGMLLLLALNLWARMLPGKPGSKPDAPRTRLPFKMERSKSEPVLDRSLPRSLRRDGWWLES